ncbi:hypothetical protein HXX76_009535 [Chlamydomonas incerta]|uniref:Inosine/uridine-preferring nucleoside hydrolase domain-containing protein n=1 Tax=Chlamydomonas incerta TaxID=51695 RepID=A0A835STE2_CHLIN|nr:hypothetical protein HXX76_009535 [Chlamydomonas incerta]|eukprot:KAG2431521.1 hypothetical protein HXX76_009535 [Chlamydomonas incerta]
MFRMSSRRVVSPGFLALSCLMLCQTISSASASRPRKVIFDHDGGIDDYVTLLLLLASPEAVRVVGITILDADCRAAVAWNTTLKLLHTLGHGAIPVAVSSLPAVNPFPDPWRNSVLSVDVMPLINDLTQEDLEPLRLSTPGEELMAQLLLGSGSGSGANSGTSSGSNATTRNNDRGNAGSAAGGYDKDGRDGDRGDGDDDDERITIVATGPLSNVAFVLKKYGRAAAARIREVWWMGGAMWVGGNVDFPGHDGSAEWNAFWDPAAVGEVWGWAEVPLIVVPLDATNAVPVTPDLIYRFGRQARHRYSVLAGTVWSRVVTWVYDRPHEPYYAWDTLTAACVLQPDLCEKLYDVESYAVVGGASQGRTVPLAPSPDAVARTAGGGGDKGSCAVAPDAEAEQKEKEKVEKEEEVELQRAEEARMLEELVEAGEGEGQETRRQHQSARRRVTVVKHVDAEAFYTFVLDTLRL